MVAVLACGLATLDVVHVLGALPGVNEKAVARSTHLCAGGPALGAAITSALLGVPATLVSAVGTGPVADTIRDDLLRYAVRLLDCASPGHEPPVSSVLVTASTGERAVVSCNAVGVADYVGLDGIGTDASVWTDIAVVLLDGHHLPLALAVAREARRRGIPVIVDGGSWKAGFDELLGLVDHAILSADFRLPGGGEPDDAVADVLALGPSFAAVTAGGGAVRWADRDGRSGSITPPAVTVIDSLGAGDVLHGAYAATLAAGADPVGADPVGALALAVEVASASVTHRGARITPPAPLA